MNPGFDLDLKYGELHEELAAKIFKGDVKIEVKADRPDWSTGNMAVEVQYRGRPSGITTTTASWWVYFQPRLKQAVLVSTDRLKYLVNKYSDFPVVGGDGKQSVLILIPVREIWGDL